MSTTYKESGKARKQCNCGVYVHARTLVCPECNYNFEKKSEEKVDKIPVVEYNEGVKSAKPPFNGRIVYAPAGEPTVPFSDNIEEWCEKVFNKGLEDNKTFSGEALYYWYQNYNNTNDARKRVYEWSEQQGLGKMQGNSCKSCLCS